MKITIKDIEHARDILSPLLPPSPLIANHWLSEYFGCNVYLKHENMQPIGSFKIRGATLKILSLSESERVKGVVAASAGNHAQGVAWGARQANVKALVVMPKTAPIVKIQNTIQLGASVHLEGESYEAAYAAAQRFAKESGMIFVHAYQDSQVISGQGTAGLEIIEQMPEVDCIVGSIGGGGLMSGVSIAVRARKPNVYLVGAQSAESDAMAKAFETGKPVLLKHAARTFADGIAVTEASQEMVQLIKENLDLVVSVDEDETALATLLLLEKAKSVVEGAGAVTLAALEKIKQKFIGKNVVLILSGGNIDVNFLSRVVDRGLVKAKRKLRIRAVTPDRPGSLAKITQLLASSGANILEVVHDRNRQSTTLFETEIIFSVETTGAEHCDRILSLLQNEKIQIDVLV